MSVKLGGYRRTYQRTDLKISPQVGLYVESKFQINVVVLLCVCCWKTVLQHLGRNVRGLAAIGPAALANAEKINRAGPLPTDAVFIDIWKGAEYGWLDGIAPT